MKDRELEDQKLKNDECIYYIKGQEAVAIKRVDGKLTITKWWEPWDLAIITLPNDVPLYTEYGEEWFGLRTVSDIKTLAFGTDTFVVPDHVIEQLDLVGGKK